VVNAFNQQEENMRNEETLVSVWDKLKPVQRRFLVQLLKNYMKDENFHQGLLPFVTISDAVFALKLQLTNYQDADQPVAGEKFISQLLSRIEPKECTPLWMHPDSANMHLRDAQLLRAFKRRYSHLFYVRTSHGLGMRARGYGHLTEMKRIDKDYWKVTTEQEFLHRITMWLADTYR
jgi:hypothetical protein